VRRCTRDTLVVVALATGLGSISGCASRMEAPTAFETYTDKEGQFTCLYPKGWEKEGGGRPDYSWAKFSKGSAQIRISADLAGSLMADIAKAASASSGKAADEEPLLQIHERMKKSLLDEFNNYREKPARTIKTKLGDARQSEFNATGSFGSRLHGLRTTFLSNDRRITVICYCMATDWRTLKPAFDTVIQSVSR